MKALYFVTAGLLAICGSLFNGHTTIKEGAVMDLKEDVYADFSVQQTDLRLLNRGGRCVLLHGRERSGKEMEEIDLGMTAPCNFIRSGNEYKPKYFMYGEGGERRAVFLIIGGPPSEEFPAKDRFMPNGCGTWRAKIYVYEHDVKVAWTGDNGPPSCPSSGADEVEFAS